MRCSGKRAARLPASPGGVIDLSKVIALYGEGRAAFPKSLALTMAWANANLSAEEFDAGADRALTMCCRRSATHRDALNGRDAGAQLPDAASRRGGDGDARASISAPGIIGDAYYWRAWNRYHLKEYETAWADVENAIKGLVERARLHARGIDRLRTQGAADRRPALRSRLRDRQQRLRRDVDVGSGQHRSERAGHGGAEVHARR